MNKKGLVVLGIGALALFALSRGKEEPKQGASTQKRTSNLFTPNQPQESGFTLNIEAPDFPTFDEAGALMVEAEVDEQEIIYAAAPKGLFEISNVTPAKARAQAIIRGYAPTGGVHLATLDTYVFGGRTQFETEELILSRERDRLAEARAAGTATMLDFTPAPAPEVGSMAYDVTAYGADPTYRNPETPIPAPTSYTAQPTDYVQDTKSLYTPPAQRTTWGAFTFF